MRFFNVVFNLILQGVRRCVEALENKKITMENRCTLHQEESLRLAQSLTIFLEQYNQVFPPGNLSRRRVYIIIYCDSALLVAGWGGRGVHPGSPGHGQHSCYGARLPRKTQKT